MKKSLIALAVAGAFAAPAAFAATANVDVYGRPNMFIEDTNATGYEMAVVDRQSILGFKGTEDLGGGLKAIWQIEQTISGNQDGVGGGTTIANRNTFVGLSGGFGTFLMGRHDTPYKLATGRLDLFSDTMADYNGGSVGAANNAAGKDSFTALVNATHDARPAHAIAYISPNFSGFSVALAGVASNAALDSGDNFDAYSLSATYSQGPLFASLAYQDVEVVGSAWKLGAGYTFGAARVGFIYEDVDNNAPTADQKSWMINGAYAMGPMTLKAQYGNVDVSNTNQDRTKFSLGLDYSLSKRTTAMVIYDTNKTKNNVPGSLNGWSVGIRHTF